VRSSTRGIHSVGDGSLANVTGAAKLRMMQAEEWIRNRIMGRAERNAGYFIKDLLCDAKSLDIGPSGFLLVLQMKTLLILATGILVQASATVQAEEGKHLFILSGQSNMASMNPDLSFTPAVEKAFGKGNVIVVKDAKNAEPISRWYKNYKPATGDMPSPIGDLYDKLMEKVNAAIADQKIATVTFLWLQGEREAKIKQAPIYAESFKGLVAQLSADLKRDDVNVVIGRINDHSMGNTSHPHWTLVREAQVQVAKELPRADWVDTDDLNGPKNGIHATKEGFVTLGERFAEKAIALIKANKK
jgi:hypothetical protein